MTFLNDNSFFVTPDSSRDFESSTNEETKKQPVKKGKGFSSRWTMTSNFTMNFNVILLAFLFGGRWKVNRKQYFIESFRLKRDFLQANFSFSQQKIEFSFIF